MSDRNPSARESLSALADGEASPAEVAQACAAWRNDPEARARWHEYQLIGDVLRSQDLAGARSSEAFLQNFRGRLAQEPVVLAPSAGARRAAAPEAAKVLRPLQRRAWTGPIAVAASFVAVVAALLGGNQGAGVGGAGGQMAGAAGGGSGLIAGFAPQQVATLADGPSFSKPADTGAELMRDPHLDQALNAMSPASSRSDLSFSNAGALMQPVAFGR